MRLQLNRGASHKNDEVRAWLARRPRWTFHFTPTSCSWVNAVEGFFAQPTRRRLKHGVFQSVVNLEAAINHFVREYNAENPMLFAWKAHPDDIIAAQNRGFQTLESIHQAVVTKGSRGSISIAGATTNNEQRQVGRAAPASRCVKLRLLL